MIRLHIQDSPINLGGQFEPAGLMVLKGDL
jgi:hypothetical protein